MEVAGVNEMFLRSKALYNVRCTAYLGEVDSRAFKAVNESKVYGEDCKIIKLECCGHQWRIQRGDHRGHDPCEKNNRVYYLIVY
jgi:hypothetical protein